MNLNDINEIKYSHEYENIKKIECIYNQIMRVIIRHVLVAVFGLA